ncbi:RNA-directed DNA polymerase, eukaryota, reverse transcriptase zinc-binding domain protein [Tanacetum coccineum]
MVRRPVRNVENDRKYGGEVNKNVQKFDVNRNKIWKQKQQAVRNEADRGIKENNNNKSFEEEFPPLWTEEQGTNKEKAMKRNNRFSVLGDREKEKNDILDGLEGIVEDVLEDESLAARKVIANEMNGSCKTHVKTAKLSDICSKVSGQWDWVSNYNHYIGGCRIVVGWNPDVVKIMVINTSRQHILCLIENIHDHKKLYCSFIYASNYGKEMRDLWIDLSMAKMCTSRNPWILMGDFNVTLNVSEHTVGKSTMDGDMEEFMECVNKIEVEDVCSTGLYFTWIKSPKKPCTSVMKKLDRIMANDVFMEEYCHAHAVFHPFLVSDHSLAVMIMPLAMEKKKSFKFANFVAD